ncbi:putative ankyrin repeat protein [Paramyrothecium foliicola]|nr:putative ankyrin repeat protein [Paramyrothecium foliicola]
MFGPIVNQPNLAYPGVDRWASDIATVRNALENGLDPNSRWNEQQLVNLRPKSGCMVPGYIKDSDTWPHYNTPLHHALRFSDVDSAELLLMHGAEIDFYNSMGRTALHEAVRNGRHEVVLFLLKNGANVNMLSKEAHMRYEDNNRDLHGKANESSLLYALFKSDYQSLWLLLSFEADLCLEVHRPWTALDLALWGADSPAVEMILDKFPTLLESPLGWESPDAEGNYTELSNELLTAANGKDLIPRKELYGAYCKTLQSTKPYDDAATEADALARGFQWALREVAGLGQQIRHEKTCSSCHKFQTQLVRAYTASDNTFRHTLHQNIQQLIDSANNGCPLCSCIVDALDRANMISAHRGSDSPSQDNQANDTVSPVQLSVLARVYGGLQISLLYKEFKGVLDTALCKSSWSDVLGRLPLPDLTTGSISAMRIAKEWVRSCEKGSGHEKCKEARRSPRDGDNLPKRLVLIGPGDDEIQIVDTPGEVQYCALSYCRGIGDFFKTTESNKLQNMKSIPRNTLPVIMQEALSVALALEYEYIWIDALCVVQDDEEEQAHEAAQIPAIFANADLTISSVVSADVHTGLFQPRAQKVLHPVPIDARLPRCDRSGDRTVMIIPEWAQKNPQMRGPVHGVASKMQEQLFSTRILWFGDGMIWWECLAGLRLEANPTDITRWGRQYSWKAEVHRQLEMKVLLNTSRPREGKPGDEPERKRELFRCWQELVEDFSRREFRDSADRSLDCLPITEALAEAADNPHRHGMWFGDRWVQSLCWRVAEPSVGPKAPDIPSWLWSSIQGEVTFEIDDTPSRGGKDPIHRITGVSLDTQIELPHNGMASSLTIRGTLCKKLPLKASYLPAENHGISLLGTRLPVPGGPVCVDQKVDTINDCFALPVMDLPQGDRYEGYGYPMWPNGKPAATVALLLQKVDGLENAFRRVGIANLPRGERSWQFTDPTRSSLQAAQPLNAVVDGVYPMTAEQWLVTNIDVFEDVEIVLV